MKATKKIFATILALCMLVGVVSTGFTAFAGEINVFQQQLDAAIAGGATEFSWTGRNITLPSTVNVRENIKINLNNAKITGPDAKPAFAILDGSNVELFNGTIEARFGPYQSTEIFDLLAANAAPAVKVVNGDLTANCLLAIGAMCRVPSTSKVYVPIGDGFEVYGGSTLTLKKSAAVGGHAVDNNSGNTGAAHVYVEDAALVGILGALRIRVANSGTPERIDYFHTLGDASVLRTADVVNAMLASGIEMDADETKIINEALYDNVTIVAQKPVSDLTYKFDGVTKDLTVIAVPDLKDIDDTVKATYSYKWIPDACTIGGVTVPFTAQEDGTYTAVYANCEDNTTYSADVNYRLLVDTTVYQKKSITDFLDDMAYFVDALPGFINEAKGKLDAKIDEINEIIDTIYEAYNGPEGVLKTYNEAKQPSDPPFEQTALGIEFTELIGCMVNLRGIELTNGGAGFYGFDTYKDLYTYAANPDNQYASIYMQGATDLIDNLNAKYSINLSYEYGEGSLTKFLAYYDEIFAIYNTPGKTVGDVAEYLGDNYLEIYDVVKEFAPIFRRAYNCLTNPNGEISQYADALSSYTDLFLTAAKALEKVEAKADEFLASATYTKITNKFPDLGGALKGYADKVYGIASNMDTYFPIRYVDESWIDFFSAVDEDVEINVAPIKYYTVRVNVTGYGGATVNDSISDHSISSYKLFTLPLGTMVTLESVVYDEACPFKGFFYTQVNQTWKRINDDSSEYKFIVSSNMNITMDYTLPEDVGTSTRTITFLCDDNISNVWIDNFNNEAGTAFTMPEAPTFKGYAFTGWSATYEEILNSADDMIVYANYEPVGTYSLTYTGIQRAIISDGTTAAAGSGSVDILNGSVVSLLAYETTADGTFRYWTDEAGNIISYNREYFFVMGKDVTRIAVYTPEEVAVLPTVSLTGSSFDTATNKMYIYSERSIPDGFTGTQTGIIVTKNADYSTADTLTLESSTISGSPVKVGVSKAYQADGVSLIPNGSYNLGISSSNTNPIYTRAYLVYRDNATNEYFTIYSDVVTVTY